MLPLSFSRAAPSRALTTSLALVVGGGLAKKVDPTAQVALGGIGYLTFLSAILRYADNPANGVSSSD
jgi:hypothetical protein